MHVPLSCVPPSGQMSWKSVCVDNQIVPTVLATSKWFCRHITDTKLYRHKSIKMYRIISLLHGVVVGAGVLNLYSLIFFLANFKSEIYPQIFYILSLLQMPIVVGKSVNFCKQNLIPKHVILTSKG